MTGTERDAEAPTPRQLLTDVLCDISQFPDGTIVTNYVGVAEVLLPNDRTHVVRLYPVAPVSGSTERGMLSDALRASEHECDNRR